MEYVCASERETLELGKKIGQTLSGGEVITLSGELGAGKTVLTKGIAQGLGVTAPVLSPTFTLLNEYKGSALYLWHFDVYRLHSAREAYEAGLLEVLGRKEGVCVLEWAQNISPALVHYNCMHITITATDEHTRVIRVRGANEEE